MAFLANKSSIRWRFEVFETATTPTVNDALIKLSLNSVTTPPLPLFATVGLFTDSCHRFSTVHVQLIQFCNIIQSFPIGDQRRLERSPASMAGRTSTLLHAGQSGRIAESVEHQLLPDHGQGHHPLRRHQRRQRPLLQLTSGRKKRKRRKKLVKTSQSR